MSSNYPDFPDFCKCYPDFHSFFPNFEYFWIVARLLTASYSATGFLSFGIEFVSKTLFILRKILKTRKKEYAHKNQINTNCSLKA